MQCEVLALAVLYRTLQCRSYQFYRDYYCHYYADEKVSADEKERFLNLDF